MKMQTSNLESIENFERELLQSNITQINEMNDSQNQMDKRVSQNNLEE